MRKCKTVELVVRQCLVLSSTVYKVRNVSRGFLVLTFQPAFCSVRFRPATMTVATDVTVQKQGLFSDLQARHEIDTLPCINE